MIRKHFTCLVVAFIYEGTLKDVQMEKTWIDDKGRLRIKHDENYQMLLSIPLDEIWHLTDSWSMELAGSLIVVGYNLDYKAVIDYGYKECEYASSGRDRASNLVIVLNRFFGLAKAAIAIGLLREHETPSKWVSWAKSKGYSVAHLLQNNLNFETNKQLVDQLATGRREKQHSIILNIIRENNLEAMKIPDGWKAMIKRECLLNFNQNFTDSGFDHAWKQGSTEGLFGMENKNKFSSSGQ